MKKFLIIISFLFCQNSFAEEIKLQRYGLYYFYGGGFGLSSLETRFQNEFLDEPDRIGYRISLDLPPSYYTENWVFDLGPGWLHTRFEDKSSSGTLIRLRTNTFFVEGGTRYRITPEWSLGPFFTLIVGEKLILGASQSVTNADSKETASQLAGLALFKEFDSQHRPMRFYVKLERSLDVERRELTTFSTGVQWSWGKHKPYIKPSSKVKVELTKNFINFKTNSDQLDEHSQSILKEIATFLQDNQRSWWSIQITGHTDNVGTAEYNKDLSERRAKTVKQVFIQNEVSKNRIYSAGFGEEQPIASNKTTEGRYKNRRVEIEFLGRTDVDKIQNFLDSLLKRSGRKKL